MGLCELLIQSGQFSFSLFQDESVILRVDFEKHVAFLYRLVILNIQVKNLTRHTRRNAHHIGAGSRIISARVSLDDSPNVERDQHRARDDDQSYDPADEFSRHGIVVRLRDDAFSRCGGSMHVNFGRTRIQVVNVKMIMRHE